MYPLCADASYKALVCTCVLPNLNRHHNTIVYFGEYGERGGGT